MATTPQIQNPDALSAKLWQRAQKTIPGGVNSPVRAFRNVGGNPFFTSRAKGSHLWDVDGNAYIDYVGTWGPAILGHAPEVVREALHHAAQKGVSYGTPHPGEVEMAELLCQWVPSLEKVRLVNSGTEATMSALRLARGFTERDLIIKFEGCYHGHVDSLLVKAGSGALTHGQPDSAGVPASIAAQTITLPFNDREKVAEIFAARGSEIAAIILEPLPANAGLIFPEEGYLAFLRQITREHGALLIFDEVMTGFRVDAGGYQQLTSITPDLSALGKVIGGGLPVGAFGGRAEIMDCLAPQGPVYQAGTLSGNPLAVAAGLAQLREMEKCQGWAALEEKGALLEKLLQPHLENRPLTWHRQGSMFCLFFHAGPIADLDDVQKCDTEKFRQFFWGCLQKGVYVAPSPYETGFISTAHTEEDITQTATVFASALEKIFV